MASINLYAGSPSAFPSRLYLGCRWRSLCACRQRGFLAPLTAVAFLTLLLAALLAASGILRFGYALMGRTAGGGLGACFGIVHHGSRGGYRSQLARGFNMGSGACPDHRLADAGADAHRFGMAMRSAFTA